MGGWDGMKCLATVEAYNPRTNTWRSCLPLGQPRTEAVAGVVGGRLVVAGGYGGPDVGILTSVEAYTPTGWTPLPPLPHATNEATACVLNGRLYVMGGMGCNKVQVLEMSEENEFAWTVKADLPTERFRAASAVADGKIWLIGGRILDEDDEDDEDDEEDEEENGSETVSIYDPANDTWAEGPALPEKVENGTATTFDGRIYLLAAAGGEFVYTEGAWEVFDGRAADFSTCGFLPLG